MRVLFYVYKKAKSSISSFCSLRIDLSKAEGSLFLGIKMFCVSILLSFFERESYYFFIKAFSPSKSDNFLSFWSIISSLSCTTSFSFWFFSIKSWTLLYKVSLSPSSYFFLWSNSSSSYLRSATHFSSSRILSSFLSNFSLSSEISSSLSCNTSYWTSLKAPNFASSSGSMVSLIID